MSGKPRTTRGRAIVALLAAAVWLFASSCNESLETIHQPLGSGPEITEHRGNPTCSEFNSNWTEIRLEGTTLVEGSYDTPDGYLTLTLSDFTGKTFDFTSTEGLDAVFVKGGPGGLLYHFNPEATEGTDLNAFWNNKEYGVSHISFCYDVEFARISIENNGINEVGDAHTFTVLAEQKIGFDGAWEPAADGTLVDVTLIPSNGAAPYVVSDTCATGTANGMCDVTFASDSAGIVAGHAAADLNVDGSLLHVETDGLDDNSANAIKRYVDASITIEPDGVNEVGAPHTFVVSVHVDDGLGNPGPPADGTNVDVALFDSFGAASVILENTCGDQGTVGGLCSVTFVSESAGSVTGFASVTVPVAGLALYRETDGVGANSGAAVKRYVDAWILIQPFAVNEVRQPHTFTIEAMMNDGRGYIGPVPFGTPIAVDLHGLNGATPVMLENTCAKPGIFAGACHVAFFSDTPGVVVGNASMALELDGVQLFRTTDGVAPNSGEAVKRYVDAWISIGPSATNGIGESHTFVVKASRDVGDGFAEPVPDGTRIDVALTPSGGAAVALSADTCATGTLAGACEVTFTSPTAGVVTGHASVTLNLAGLPVFRETDGLFGNSGDATKTFRDGLLEWAKVDETGAPLAGATFEVCQTHTYVTAGDFFAALFLPVCQTVTDALAPPASSAGDQDAAAGGFRLVALPLGRYTIAETLAPEGYVLDDTVATIDITTAAPEGRAYTFVNVPEEDFSGCTPGYWRNHTKLWDEGTDAYAAAAGFTTGTGFNAYFALTEAESGFPDGLTMDDAVNLGGGDEAKLARHGTAALLNMATEFPYDYSAADVDALKAELRNAFLTHDYEPLASLLAAANEVGCQIN